MKKIFKILGIFVLLILAGMLMASSFGVRSVYNPFTQKLDYVTDGNLSDLNVSLGPMIDNLNMSNYNLTDVDCILFISGGQICDSP